MRSMVFAMVVAAVFLVACGKGSDNAVQAAKLNGTYRGTNPVFAGGQSQPVDFSFTLSATGDLVQGTWTNTLGSYGTFQARVQDTSLTNAVLTYTGVANGIPDSTGCTGLFNGLGNIVNITGNTPNGFTLLLNAQDQSDQSGRLTQSNCGDIGAALTLILSRQ